MALSINTKDFFETIKPFKYYEEVTVYIDNTRFVDVSYETFEEDVGVSGRTVIRDSDGEEVSLEDFMEMVKDYKVIYFEAEQILNCLDGEGIHFDIYLR